MIRELVEVRNRLGLHARAAAQLVQTASRFSSDIRLSREGCQPSTDSKSILQILMMAAAQGTRLVVSIEGKDEREAGETLRRLFENKFGEEN